MSGWIHEDLTLLDYSGTVTREQYLRNQALLDDDWACEVSMMEERWRGVRLA